MAAQKASSKAERVAAEVARAVNAGKPVAVETVDFSDPNRPKTCLEVDFPILPVNQVAGIEASSGAAMKPVYQMSKWWARRPSSVFRSMLLAAAMKAPNDPAEAAKAVWDVYYCNHQKKGALSNLKVADIFMGGGTTVVEGSRLGMQMYGNDLNPVAWFVVKNELAQVSREDVETLFADIEAEVKPQIMPFYACDGPNGEKGKWTRISTGEVMGEDFDPLALTPDERPDYSYEGPEIIYTFWAKHGPCQVTGCGHRTPIMSTPVVAAKTITVKAWPHLCSSCGDRYEIEETETRMAPDAPLVVADGEAPYAIQNVNGIRCPGCGHEEPPPPLKGKGNKRKVELTVLVHPDWLKGESSVSPEGNPYGGCSTDSAESTAAWNLVRAEKARLVEVRGKLPDEVTCPETAVSIKTGSDGGTVPKKSHFTCGSCGREQDILEAASASGKGPPFACYAIQGYSTKRAAEADPLSGRYFARASDSKNVDAASAEWERRRSEDLARYWPKESLPEGFKTTYQRIPEHGYPRYADMFYARQLLFHSQLVRSLSTSRAGRCGEPERWVALGAFQQFLRYCCAFTIWHTANNQISAFLSNNNYPARNTTVETSPFAPVGDGSWHSATRGTLAGLDWKQEPWELVATESLRDSVSDEVRTAMKSRSMKVYPSDKPISGQNLMCGSATDLKDLEDESCDLVVTDPPFGNNIQYSELADFFYVWLRLGLGDKAEPFGASLTPKQIEAVENPVRNPSDPAGYYQRVLMLAWAEAARVLRPGGILAFTFHHSEDRPWVAVLTSLFEAGFYLEATYPIRSDETKGEGSKPGTFGSQKIEYDIVHVCRKRLSEPAPVSWAKMRREVLQEVRRLQSLLEHHQNEGLPDADLQVIRRGKALEYFSRHYGQVYVDEGKPVSVLDALVGINQLLDEEMGAVDTPPPVTAEPFTRQFLRLFDGISELPRDQIQKFLRGTGIAPSDFEERGWCEQKKKVFRPISPIEIAREWQGRHRKGLTSDYDQAMFLIGACFENSGINASDTLANENFRPHPALAALLDWFAARGADQPMRTAAARARTILRSWQGKQRPKGEQLGLFAGDDEEPA